MESSLNGSVQEFDPSSGTSLGTFATLQPGYVAFTGMAAGNGDVYLAEVSSSRQNTLFSYSQSGAFLGSFNLFGNPLEDMAVGSNGNLFVMGQEAGGTGQGFIDEYSPTTGASIPFPSPGVAWAGSGNFAQSMAIAPNGNVVFGDQSGIEVYTSGDVLLDAIAAGGTPVALYVTPGGDVYATVGANLLFCAGCQAGNPGSNFAQLFGADPNNGMLSGLIASPDGSEILLTSLFAGTILKFDAATGAYLGVLSSTGAGTSPDRLALIGDAPAAAPEPGTWVLAVAALAIMMAARDKKRYA